MTNGEYYSALSNIMQRIIPEAEKDLYDIKRHITIMSYMEMINNLHASGIFDDIKWRQQLMDVAESAKMFEWTYEEKKHLLGSLADEK